jgi:hypothetical protein
LRQKQSIRSIETVKADTARKNSSISIAFSRWREDQQALGFGDFFPRIPKKPRLEATFSAFSTLVRRLHFAVARLPQRQKWHANCFIRGTIEELAFWLTIRL